MKKIVFLHTDFRIYWPARLNNLYAYLQTIGIELMVIEISGFGENYNFDNREKPDHFWDCLFPDKSIHQLEAGAIRVAILQRLEAIKPDILVTGALAFPSGATGVYYANAHHIPIIVFDDARLEDVPRNFFVNYVKRQLYSGVDAIFCPAPGWNQTFSFFGFEQDRVFHGVDVVDNNFFMNPMHPPAELPALPDTYFLNVGRQVEKKNLQLLLKSYHQLSLIQEDVPHLVLVGDGTKRSAMEGYIKDYKLEKVHFLPFLPQHLIKQIYQRAQAFILPSAFGETWGLVINEAMASGLPVIVSNKVGCVGTLVNEGYNGFVFDPNQTSSLLEKLNKFLMLDPEEKKAMGQASQQIIQRWGLDKFNEGMVSAINFVGLQPKRKLSPMGRIFTRFWLGRYNSL